MVYIKYTALAFILLIVGYMGFIWFSEPSVTVNVIKQPHVGVRIHIEHNYLVNSTRNVTFYKNDEVLGESLIMNAESYIEFTKPDFNSGDKSDCQREHAIR